MQTTIRRATLEDIPLLERLIADSARSLRNGYTEAQVEAALGYALGVDRQLIRDGTYFAVEADSHIVACGGWSKRKTLFGSDHVEGKDDAWLDPAVDPARIRAFFVHPAWARRGIGSALLAACETAAQAEGFSCLELVSTLPGEPLYRARGFVEMDRFAVSLPQGESLPVIRMTKSLTR